MASTSKHQRPNGWTRRIAKACDSCRRRRTKCSGARPTCSQCVSANTNCHYSDRVDRQAGRRNESNVRRLQARVRELEAAQNIEPGSSPTSRQSSLEAGPRTSQRQYGDVQESNPAKASSSAATAIIAPIKHSEGRETMVAESTGELRYFGPSSSVSVLSPVGLEWIQSRTADASLRQRLEMPLKGAASWASWTHPLLQSLWPTTLSTPLPPWNDALALVNEFLENYNTTLPIFHPPTLMGLLGQQYARSTTAIEDPALSVALNAMLAMAQRKRAEQNPRNQELADRAWAWAKNSLEAVLAVLMRSVSLLSVQALLALACFFRGTPNPQPFFFLTAAALRLSHSAGLHRAFDHLPLSAVDREQRLRVFWIALVFDSRASIRTGRPFAHDINDISIPLPSESPKDNLGMIVNRDGSAILNVLLAEARFAVIEGRVYQNFFAATSSGKSIEALSADIQTLGEELDNWGQVFLRGMDCSSIMDQWSHQLPTVISLVLSYHSRVITVQAAAWQRYFSLMRGVDSGQREFDLNSSYFPNAERCLESAHEIIKLLAFVPRENLAFLWEIIHFPVQALMLLFICILQNPRDANVNTRFGAINDAINLVSQIVTTQEDSFLRPILAVCHELSRVARMAIQKAWAKTDTLSGHTVSQTSDGESTAVSTHTTHCSTPAIVSDHDNRGLSSIAANYDLPIDFAELGSAAPQGAEPGAFSINQLSDLPLSFTWNWHDLSASLLEGFDFA
ncbi:putative fungal-specific transcription factor [Dactylonectria macrodidyma]|uniref:Fungal-specific transcription factor n=1 Tax=Dactylonectria macrodidyma TaxID=307937 RepID=A0A9P9F4W9_9HYPO|nr:putative fungal-specific transcription factor [Dactylonectria macrodidyma]